MTKVKALVAILMIVGAMPVRGSADASGPVLAGAAKVDSTWHVGASSGQYSGEGPGPYDPRSPSRGVEAYQHSWISRPSYGLQGREWVRALVLQGADGRRIALVSNDLYIPQDLVNRRVAGLLAEHDRLVDLGVSSGPKVGIDDDDLVVSVSHSHSSPYYSTPAWGPWAFQDSFDIRYYEHIATKMADAVIAAATRLVPVRIGGSVSYFDKLQRHSYGPTVGDDGTPAGFPEADFPENRTAARTENEKLVFVVRFDDVSDPASPKPLANWVTFGLHPEMLDGNDLLTGEYVNTMYRFLDREIGGITLFSQENTGTAEPAREGRSQVPAARAEFSHKEYAQMERAARLLADVVKETRLDIENNTPEDPNQFAPFRTEMPVKMLDLRFAAPSYRASPTVSNCRSEKVFQGNPGVPIAGLPDCEFPAGGATGPVWSQLPVNPRVTYDALREAGVPIPENYGAPSFAALQETLLVHMQAIRLGDIAITVCPCEQWGDQARNIRSRLNRIDGDLWLGFDWTEHPRDRNGTPWCRRNADTTWTCADPRAWRWEHDGDGTPRQVWDRDLPPISDLAYRRMRAQIHNDAKGWEDLEYTAHAEYEPTDPAKIKGNFTHEELTEHGYKLVIPVGMTNDYWGYIASYREWNRGDHYRKALTGLGPHSMDFFATRLSRMAATLNGGSFSLLGPKDLAMQPEDAREYATAQAIGEAARALVPAYEATLPANGGAAGIQREPSDVTRFGVASVRWTGGDPYTDTPDVRVERLVDGTWRPFANGEGEVQYRTFFPAPEQLPALRAGQFAWSWEATFEAFASDIQLVDAGGAPYRATPAGTYRFVIGGTRRGTAGATTSYALASRAFDVRPWTGITVPDIRRESDGTVSFDVGPSNHYKYGRTRPQDMPSPLGWRVGPVDYPDTDPALSIYPFITSRDRTINLAPGGAGFADDEQFCLECSFRPWADSGTIARAEVTIERAGGTTEVVPATRGSDGRWRTTATLAPGDRAWVAAHGLADAFGHTNGQSSALVTA